jgi:hypothetical protein
LNPGGLTRRSGVTMQFYLRKRLTETLLAAPMHRRRRP